MNTEGPGPGPKRDEGSVWPGVVLGCVIIICITAVVIAFIVT